MKTIAQLFIFIYPTRFEIVTVGAVVIDGKDYSHFGDYGGDIDKLPGIEADAERAGFTRQPGDDGLHIWSRYTDDEALAAGEAGK